MLLLISYSTTWKSLVISPLATGWKSRLKYLIEQMTDQMELLSMSASSSLTNLEVHTGTGPLQVAH